MVTFGDIMRVIVLAETPGKSAEEAIDLWKRIVKQDKEKKAVATDVGWNDK